MTPAAGDCTGVVDVDPGVGPGSNTWVMRLGVLKLARLSRLKISALNCRFKPSNMCVSLSTEKSHVARPGPMYASRATFPKKPLLFGGAMKAFGSNHWLGFPSTTEPEKLGLRNARTGLRVSPSLEGLYPSCGVNGNPD